MSNNEKKRFSFIVDDDATADVANEASGKEDRQKKLKKLIIYILMSIACIGCLYLIFRPSASKKKTDELGLNKAVPQASEARFPDKQKAYEQELLEKNQAGQKAALVSLSDYLNSDTTRESQPAAESIDSNEESPQEQASSSIKSYRNVQSALGAFYEDKTNYEAKELRRQLDEANKKLAEQETTPGTSVQDQLAVMEKSYEMASRYFPSNYSNSNQGKSVDSGAKPPERGRVSEENEGGFVPVIAARRASVTQLRREWLDSDFVARFNENANLGFYTATGHPEASQTKNSVRASVQETQTVIGDGTLRLRLVDAAKTPRGIIPRGTIIAAQSKIQNGRLQIKVTSVELAGDIIPVDLIGYDLDGQQGLFVPYSPEMNAVSDIAANMSQNSGTSIMMPRSAGQQIAGDLSRSLVQGVSGYLSKKVRTPKVTIKSGQQVFLLSKK